MAEGTKTYVWVPRFTYKQSPQVEMKFLKGNSVIATDGSNINITNDGQITSWNIPSALKDVTGIWVEIKAGDNKSNINLINILNDTLRTKTIVI